MKSYGCYLGPLLRWIRGGTTRRGNPWAAVLFTFILVQVSFIKIAIDSTERNMSRNQM